MRRAKTESMSEDLSGWLVTITEPRSGASEAYRMLRTNLLYVLSDAPSKVVLLTSPGPMEGKSTTCANLGVVLAQAEMSVLLVDCDFQRPVLHRVFGVPNLRGITDVLAEEHSLREARQESPVPNLKVLPTGLLPLNPAELLGSARFAELLAQVRQEFDYVLLDAPPASLFSDAFILARQVDGLLLVVDAKATSQRDLRRAMHGLRNVGSKILGTVLNNTDASETGYSSYTYG